MVVVEFPPIENVREDGLLAFGGDTEIESLLLAYRRGIFPWPVAKDILTWFAPPERAVLQLDEFHRSRTLRKKLRSLPYEIKVDTDFDSVIKHCSELVNRGNQSGTWITDEIVTGYTNLHKAGYAHSIECFENSTLIGGVYGVALGSYFSAESMFYRKPYASMFALNYLVNTLASQGMTWMDCQVMSPLLERLGAKNIKRADFMELLTPAINGPEISLG